MRASGVVAEVGFNGSVSNGIKVGKDFSYLSQFENPQSAGPLEGYSLRIQ